MVPNSGTGHGGFVPVAVGLAVMAATSALYGYASINDRLALSLGSRVPPPVELVRTGILPPGVVAVPSAAALRALGWAMWRSPLEQRLLNRRYVEATRLGDRGAENALAGLSHRLGWRDTATTQNLMMRDAFGGRYARLIDRGDSLVRRGQLEDNVFRFFGALESLPSMQARLVERLRARVPWRARYLGYMALGDSPQFRAARLRTLDALLGTGDRPGRAELAPFVSALVAHGAVDPAWRLWRRTGGSPGGGVGLNDGDFRAAHRLHGENASLTPFDWQLGSSGEFAASVPDYRPSGVSLRWNGQGIPVFVSQQVRLPVADRLAVTITSDKPDLAASLLQPVLACDGAEIIFAPTGTRGKASSFVAERPVRCAFATFSLRGRVTDDPSPDPIEIAAIGLRGS